MMQKIILMRHVTGLQQQAVDLAEHGDTILKPYPDIMGLEELIPECLIPQSFLDHDFT